MGWARALAACGARADGGLTTAARLVDALEARAKKAVRAGSTFVANPWGEGPEYPPLHALDTWRGSGTT